MESTLPGPARTIRLLAGLAGRRWINRMSARFRRRKAGPAGDARTGTARKEQGGGAMLVLLGGMFILSGVNISFQFVVRLSLGLGAGPLVNGELPWSADLVRGAGVILALLALGHLWLSLGTGNQDLGKVEWSLEWLFTLPAPPGRLFLAKIFEYAFINPFGGFMIFPFLLTAYWTSGRHAWAIPQAAAATLALGFVLGSVRLAVETALRMRLSIDRLKNAQAVCTVVGTVFWLGVLGLAMARPVPAFFLELAPRLPDGALWNPLSAAVLLCSRDAPAWKPVAVLAGSAVLFPIATMILCRRLVRDGLLTTSGTYTGSRRAGPALPEPRGLLRGVLAKDVRLLFRDRNFLVSTLVVPVMVFAFQAILFPDLLNGVTGDFRHAATLAYGLGAYILMSSAFHVLTVEGQSLWLLYTFPRELHRILIEKTIVWAAMALFYSALALGITAGLSHGLGLPALGLAAMALGGVVLAAFTAAALGTLATDPLQHDVQRKIRTEIVYLYMLLSGLYGTVLYGPSPWLRFVQTVLSVGLVVALWQKVRDRLPYLLDPTEAPPPKIALSDGMIAVLAFYVLYQMILRVARASGSEPGPALFVFSYAAAAGVVVLSSLYVFWRLDVPDLAGALGLRGPKGSLGRALVEGPMAGLAAAVVGVGYLIVLEKIPALRRLAEDSPRTLERLRDGGPGAFAVIVLVAAPLFEEYLFRGLVYKGMRQKMKPAAAILASSALFALVHDPLRLIPVFGTGVAAAFVFERTGLLLAPILAHAVYNAAVAWASR